MTDNESGPGWHLDKKVPLAILGSIAMQTAIIIWWASGVEHRMQTFEQRIAEIGLVNKAQDTRSDIMDSERRINLQRLSRVEQSLTDIRDFMGRIDNKLERIGPPTRRE